jgi:tRNA pseudouridine38-40 synthase
VQGELETALGTILRADPPPVTTVAGRTDAGVHARGQVCHVDVQAEVWAALPGRTPAEPAESLVHRLAGLLPLDIRVHHAAIVSSVFDARFSALARRYAYRIWDDPAAADPLRRDVLVLRRQLDVAAMDTAAAPLVGEHDYAAFCKPREGATTIRRVLSLRCTRDPDDLVMIDIQADAFCHHMVRAIVGALVAVGEGRRELSWPGEILEIGERDSAVTVLPPGGLTLESVTYPPEDEVATRAMATRAVRSLG